MLFDYWPVLLKLYMVMIRYAQMTLNVIICNSFEQVDYKMCVQRLWNPIMHD